MSEVLRLSSVRWRWRTGAKMVADFRIRAGRLLRLPRPVGDQAQIIREAAAASHMTTDAFLLDSAIVQAHAVLDDEWDVVLSPEAFDDFVHELDEPPEDMPGLRKMLSSTIHRPTE